MAWLDLHLEIPPMINVNNGLEARNLLETNEIQEGDNGGLNLDRRHGDGDKRTTLRKTCKEHLTTFCD